jgi:predicted nucleic acid-binding protein
MRGYFDSSALVKFALPERESMALVDHSRQVTERFTSVVGRIEFERAVRRARPEVADELIDGVLRAIHVIPLHNGIAGIAGSIRPTSLRTLDALHLASIVASDAFDVVYCYDMRLAAAARERGITVLAPA